MCYIMGQSIVLFYISWAGQRSYVLGLHGVQSQGAVRKGTHHMCSVAQNGLRTALIWNSVSVNQKELGLLHCFPRAEYHSFAIIFPVTLLPSSCSC